MRETFQIKLPASITAATARSGRPSSPRTSAVPARGLKPVAQPHVTRSAAPRRAAY
ncbi:hypothetical protein HD597_009973 [Nonomuraea thailandensis]|uniref:Uncharacterized protein n=1 Tax=Nonomuraea thailandensis TaxID=1188745 RepID=A0A9X2GYY0_9ACTN|nr:hypothetical protein [Nonomuraea thailandensis]MCP2362953.1 hypothetical protein [Nonomuraea thailandensis]